MSEKAEIGVIHGRFQVLHNDHLRYLLAGKERCRHLVVGVTNPDPFLTRPDSSDARRDSAAANPFTYYERLLMVRSSLLEAGIRLEDFTVVPFPVNIPELYHCYLPMEAVFYLTLYDQWGEKKLAMFQELGLKVDILWRRAPEQKGLSGTEVRRRIAAGLEWRQLVPASVEALLTEWRAAERLKALSGSEGEK